MDYVSDLREGKREKKKRIQRGRLSHDRRNATIRIKEIPINQLHLTKGKHSSKCPSAINPYCDYCICGLKGKNKLVKNSYTDPAVQRQRDQFKRALSKKDIEPRDPISNRTKHPYWNQNSFGRRKDGF